MSKEQKPQKNVKKKPLMSAKEKKIAKREKKMGGSVSAPMKGVKK